MMSHELILTLAIPPEQLAKLGRLAAIRKRVSRRARSYRVASVYYDTREGLLRGHGVALKVRTTGRNHVQSVTAKGRSVAGLPQRRHWQSTSPAASPAASQAEGSGAQPAASAIDDPVIRRLIEQAGEARLEAIFRTDIRRTSRLLSLEEGGEATADVDVGEIVVDGIRQAICELRLDLKAGASHELFDLALELHSAVPLRLTSRSTARGQALLAGRPPGPRKAGPLVLPPDATVEQAFGQIVEHCLGHLLGNLPCVLETDDPGGVHQTRVALRRLRSALGLFRPALPRAMHRWLAAETRWLAKQLAAARDVDVILQTILDPVAARLPEAPDFEALRARLVAHRERSRLDARAAARSARFTRLLLQLGAWHSKRAWQGDGETAALHEPAKAFADRALAKRHRRVRKTGRAFARLTGDERHRLRVEVKKLRYATDFFGSLYSPKPVKRYTARLAELQDQLGYLADVAMARRTFNGMLAPLDDEDAGRSRHAAGLAIGWHSHKLAERCVRLTRDLAALPRRAPFLPGP